MVITASFPENKFFRKYIDIINVLLVLSNREMDVLALLMRVDYGWHSAMFKDILDGTSRKYIMRESYVNKSNLSRYISLFKEKDILVNPKNEGWEINRKIMPKIKGDDFTLTFEIKIKENEQKR